jgi:GntR family transcriptional regulator, rspAB operon transcriptional repressor
MERDKRQQAYTTIKQKIISGELPPATDLSEEKLIQELGISRTPIREALQKLNEQGFISIYPRKGTIVSDITLDMINWTYEARKLNEPFITKNACGRLSIDWLLKMKRAFEAIYEEADANTEETRKAYIELDRELHDTILETCTNMFLKNFMKIINDHSHRFRIKTGGVNMQYKSAVEEHLCILDALIEGDAEKVEAAAKEHVLKATKTAYQYI